MECPPSRRAWACPRNSMLRVFHGGCTSSTNKDARPLRAILRPYCQGGPVFLNRSETGLSFVVCGIERCLQGVTGFGEGLVGLGGHHSSQVHEAVGHAIIAGNGGGDARLQEPLPILFPSI